MQQKKAGAVTLFIILGLIILVFIAFLVFFLLQKIPEKSIIGAEISKQEVVNEIKNNIEECLVSLTEDAIRFVGANGGYSSPILETENGIAYLMYFGDVLVLDENQLKASLAEYIDSSIEFICVEENLTISNVKTYVDFGNENVNIEIDGGIKVAIDDSVFEITPLNINVASRIKEINNIAKEILASVSKDGICITCIADIAKENNVTVDITSSASNVTIFNIIDRQVMIENEQFEFIFATKV